MAKRKTAAERIAEAEAQTAEIIKTNQQWMVNCQKLNEELRAAERRIVELEDQIRRLTAGQH